MKNMLTKGGGSGVFKQIVRFWSSYANTNNLTEVAKFWGQSRNPREEANLTFDFYSTDTEERFKKNKKQLKQLGLDEMKITYSLNEHGFRCDTFKKKCKILFNGDSYTQGIGVPLDKMYSKMLADHLKIPHHNVACASADWQHIAQRTVYWVPKLKPQYLILNNPPDERFNWWKFDNYLDKDLPQTECSTTMFDTKKMLQGDMKHFIDLISEPNAYWYKWSMLLVIEKICKENNCKLIVRNRKRYPINEQPDYARDLEHWGINWHNNIFNNLKRSRNITI